MRVSKMAAAAIGAGLAFGQVAQAQDYGRAFDQVLAERSQSNAVSLRWSAPLGGGVGAGDDGRFALRLTQSSGGASHSLDVMTYSFGAPEGERLATPFQLNANDDGSGVGGWISSHKLLFGAGLALAIWGVVEATQDDDHHSSPGQCITSC